MSIANWSEAYAQALGVRLSGEAGLTHLTSRGDQEPDDTFLVLLNASPGDLPFRVPKNVAGVSWRCLINTTDVSAGIVDKSCALGAEVIVNARSLQLFILNKNTAH